MATSPCTNRRTRTLSGWPLAAAAGFALSLGLLAGCDGDSDASVAISRAANQLEALAPAGTGPASAEIRRTTYTTIAQSLTTAASKGTPSESATAQVLIAEAQSGLAQLRATEASELEATALNAIRKIRAAQADWVVRSARAAASAAYDPAPELAEIAEQVKMTEELIDSAESRLEEVRSRIAGLKADAEKKLAEAAEGHAREGTLRQQALEATAVEGARLLEEAVRIKRAADAKEVEAGNLEARAAQIEPETGEIELTIGKLRTQIEDLNAARERVNARARQSREDAEESRRAAQAVADDLDAMVAELTELRAGPLAEATREAVRHYGAALTAARSAAKESRSAAQLVSGKANQSLGDVHWTSAQGLNAFADTLSVLANSEPALPNASQYRAAADEARAKAAEALTAAGEAYSAAHQAYGAAGAKGEAAERLDALRGRLDSLASTVSDGKIDLGADEEPGATASADDDAADNAAGGPSPEATVDALLDLIRANRFSAASEHIYLENPANRSALLGVLDVTESFVQFNDALKREFGTGLLEIAAQQPGGIPGLPPGMDPQAVMGEAFAELETASSGDFTFEVTGDTATVIPASGSGGEPMQMRLVDGRWLIDLTPLESMIQAQPQADQYRQLVDLAVPLVNDALRQTIAEIEDGRFDSAQTAVNALNLKLQPAIFQIMGKMQELGIQPPGMPGGG